jgi:hypothetical protein
MYLLIYGISISYSIPHKAVNTTKAYPICEDPKVHRDHARDHPSVSNEDPTKDHEGHTHNNILGNLP